MNLTEKAYNYARSQGRVSQGVIEAYKKGYRDGRETIRKAPVSDLFNLIRHRYPTQDDVLLRIGAGDLRRGISLEETQLIMARRMLDKFWDEFSKVIKENE